MTYLRQSYQNINKQKKKNILMKGLRLFQLQFNEIDPQDDWRGSLIQNSSIALSNYLIFIYEQDSICSSILNIKVLVSDHQLQIAVLILCIYIQIHSEHGFIFALFFDELNL
ncbi:hypothetical protein pb186bvf_009285 [Paramecium bursaria]